MPITPVKRANILYLVSYGEIKVIKDCVCLPHLSLSYLVRGRQVIHVELKSVELVVCPY